MFFSVFDQLGCTAYTVHCTRPSMYDGFKALAENLMTHGLIHGNVPSGALLDVWCLDLTYRWGVWVMKASLACFIGQYKQRWCYILESIEFVKYVVGTYFVPIYNTFIIKDLRKYIFCKWIGTFTEWPNWLKITHTSHRLESTWCVIKDPNVWQPWQCLFSKPLP